MTVSRILLLILAALVLAPELHAQDRRLAGTVVAAADSTTLEGVSVGVVGTAAATITDAAGRFLLQAPVGAVRLTIRRIGLAPDTFAVAPGQDSVVLYARVSAV